MRNIFYIFVCCILLGCEKYLDEKPDKTMTVPLTLDDCDALLDDRSTMNSMYPVAGEVGSDYYYLLDQNYNALTNIADRNAYVWDPQTDLLFTQWQGPYKIILIANQVLDLLSDIDRATDPLRFDRIKGEAYFFRGYAYAQLADVFTLPYQESTADNTLGLPIRLNPESDYESRRATLRETYSQIRGDLQLAAQFLPENVSVVTRPSRTAALGALARVALIMEDYNSAKTNAEKALELNSVLIDYNTLSKSASAPFPRFNKEVIFHASTLTSTAINPSIAKIDKGLTDSYAAQDLRKQLFFKANTDGSYAFKGRYDGQVNAASFCGLAADELYFVLSEAYARLDNITEAMQTLNSLLITRWTTGSFLPFEAADRQSALDIILSERKKSMIFRNLRWGDLKRLNLENRYATEIKRTVNAQEYVLSAGDNRFAFLIPIKVMDQSNLEQNKR